eukprot:TRINITY_DN2922_c0_g1_i1.p1 TRINITY_DN2922_c0_g1~~TRINITY_DN2922_c0_g1_i1.p1  ORF type:complete len:226 (-),score=39.83 TRINITY_DN2922_c0_g1_i1:163-840(-)
MGQNPKNNIIQNQQLFGQHFQIIMELGDYCLMDIIQQEQDQLPLELIVEGLVDMINVLCYLQDLGICHRDIKPQNILIKDGKFKLSDFGTTKQVGSAMIQEPSIVGTFEYWSPELFQLKNNDGSNQQLDSQQLQPEEQNNPYQFQLNLFKNDVFSLGLTFLSLLLQQKVTDPKQWNQDNNLLQQQLHKIQDFNPKFYSILEKMLAFDPQVRLDFIELQKIVKNTF